MARRDRVRPRRSPGTALTSGCAKRPTAAPGRSRLWPASPTRSTCAPSTAGRRMPTTCGPMCCVHRPRAYIQPESWKPVGRLRARWLKPGETVLGPLNWTPAGPGPYALLVRLSGAGDDVSAAFDPAKDENVAQQNLWLVSAAAGSKVEVAFDLTGVPGKSGAVSLVVDRGSLPADVVVSPISIGPAHDMANDVGAGNTRGIVDNAVIGAITGGLMLGMGQRRRASLAITLPAQAASRDTLCGGAHPETRRGNGGPTDGAGGRDVRGRRFANRRKPRPALDRLPALAFTACVCNP